MKVWISNKQGFTLLEVLVSVVVLSIGLLGLAALQSTSMRFNHDARLRAIATSQVNTMIDYMRDNPQGVTDGSYNNLSGIPGPAPNCASACTAAQIAQLNAVQWNTDNATYLPSGRGTVTVNGSLFRITVMWDNDRSGALGTGCSGNPTVDLTCLTMQVRI